MPPRRIPTKPAAPKGGTVKEISKEGAELEKLENKVKEQDDQLVKLHKTIDVQRDEIMTLKQNMETLLGFDEKVTSLTRKVEAITGVYDDLHEKMHEMDKTKRNNLLFYGIKPDFLPEIQHQLDQKIHEIIRHRLCFSRDVPTTKITRMLTGPEVRGSRPVLVSFASYKDREEILSKSRLLKGTNIYITEDLSRKMREHRSELTKYMRQIRTRSPHKKCTIRYDKLYIDNTPYVWDEVQAAVVRYVPPESQRPLSRNNYSRMDESYYGGGGSAGLVRSTSVPSVNGVLKDMHALQVAGGLSDRLVDSEMRAGGSRTSLASGKFASNESLHLGGGAPHEQPEMCVTPIIEEGMLSPRRGGGVSVYEAAGHGGYMMNGGSFSPRSLSPLHQQQLMQQQLPPPSPTAHPDAGGPYNPQTIRTDANVTPLKLRGPTKRGGEKSNAKSSEPPEAAPPSANTDENPVPQAQPPVQPEASQEQTPPAPSEQPPANDSDVKTSEKVSNEKAAE